jgi:hypothetical protein
MEFYWCLSCGRTFLETTGYSGTCVLTGCDGDTASLTTWETVRERHPEYPATPVPRVAYPLRGRQAQVIFH